MQEATFPPDQPSNIASERKSHGLVRLATAILPVLTIGIIVGSLFLLQWAGQQSIKSGYPQPEVRIESSSGTTFLRNQFSQFSAKASGRELTYRWDFGDQTTESGKNVGHSYQRIGTFTITVIVTDAAKQWATQTIKVTVTPLAPHANFLYTQVVGGYYTFDAYKSFADASTSIAIYYWDFGDGNTQTTRYTKTSHSFARGTYTVTLTVIDAAGQVSKPVPTTISVS